MRRLKKIIIGVAIFFFVFTVAGFFIVPPILKSILTNKLSEALHRQVTIKEIKINPYTLTLTGKGVKVNDRDSTETFLSFDELFVNLQSFSALKWAILLKEIRIKQPYLKIIRHQDSSFNFSDLMGKKEVEEKVEEEGKGKGIPLKFSFNNISIENGSIDFWDEPKGTKHALRELNFGLPFLSNIPYHVENFIQPALSAKINETPYSIQGKTKPFSDSLETSFDINISDFNIPYYLAYAPIEMNFKILSGYLDVKGEISFIQYKDKNKPPSLKATGEVTLRNLAVDDSRGKPLLRLPLFETAIASGEPISKSFHLSKISIQSPEFHIRRDPRGTLNIETILPKETQTRKKTTNQEDSSPLSLDIDEIKMGNGKIFFSDLSGSKPFKTIIDPMELRVNHFSNGKDKRSVYTLLLKTEAKETIQLEGELSINPLLVDGKVEIKSVPFKKYSSYYSDKFLFDIEDGILDLSARYKYGNGGKTPELYLSEMSTAIRKLRLKGFEETEDFLNIPILSVRNTTLDLRKKEISVGEFSTQKGILLVRRLENGEINLLNLLPPAEKEEKESVQASTGTKEEEKPWSVKAKRILVDGYTIKGEDQVPVEPVNLMIDEMSLKAENFSMERGHRGNIALTLRLNQKGTMTATGSIGIQPLFANLTVALKEVGIRSFQPYFSDKVKITVTDGFISTAGNLILNDQKEKEIRMAFKGESSLTNFASIDKVNAEDFLKWESLSLEDIHVGYNPLFIHLNAIALANFYARVIIYPDGSINLQKILEEGEEKEKVSPSTPPQAREKESPSQNEETTPKDIKIEKVVLQGGHINFSDFFIKPNYTANMTGMGGRISGLSSEETTLAEVEVRGKLNHYAPLEIIGKINPLKEDPHVDLEIKFKDIDLSPFTPYAGKYVGYTVQKGKLSMDLKYLIVNKKLTAQNKIFFDQFTFGDRVESPEATKLPVKFAISLLKDRKGEIHLDIPLSGSLDDPKFRIGKIILQILANLISKAVTSPFALLGAAFGGGEELSYLEFDYGSFAITEPNMKKVDTLIKALQERPGIRLDIEGHVDMERDREGLKQYLFQKKIKVQKLNEMVKKGSPAVPVDDIEIEPKDYQRYLKMAYKAENFPKPKNILGFPKDLPVPEMEKLMLTHTEVKEDDLRSLASQRASRVKALMLKSGQIAPERIFLIEPESLAPEKKEKLKDSRVDFKLK